MAGVVAGHLSRLLPDRLGVGEHAARVHRDVEADVGERDGAAAAGEELDAELLLEAGDGAADAGLAHRQALAREREPSRVGDRQEHL